MHLSAMTVKEGSRASGGGGQIMAMVGGILGAIAASSCCVLPLVFVSLGVSGAWIGNLTVLAPYQPYFVAFTVAVLGYGFCEQPVPSRGAKLGLWLGTVLVVVALIFPRVALLLAE